MGIYKIRTEFGQHLRWLMGILAVIFIIGGAFMFSGMPGGGRGGQAGGSDEVVATVSGMPITKGEMDATWTQTSEALRERGVRSTLQFAQQKTRVFGSLVESRVTLILAKAMGVEINNREVNAKRDQMIVDFLRDNRRRVLGKLDAARDKTDPRDDSEYKSELAKNNMSLSMMEDRAGTLISEGQIQYQLAQEGMRKAIKDKAGSVSEQDIMDSYNVYSMRQIFIPKAILPGDQLQTRVNKIVSQAKGGGDFAALAKQYSQDPTKGGVQSIGYGMLAPEVWDQIVKLKAGQVSNPIETDQAVYIVKVEGVTPKLPAKLDKKATDERRGMIENQRQMQEYLKYDKAVRSKLVVQVTDPELQGYWYISQLQQTMGNPVTMKKQLSLARNALEKAISKEPNNSFATAMLAVVLRQQGDNNHATQLLYQLLEGKDSKGEGSDLRIMLGDMLYQAGKKDEATKQYTKAAEAAGIDVAAHQQLEAKFKQIGRADLAANEQKWLTDYEANKKLYEAQQGRSAPRGVPVPAGGP